jgi:hypothetical protein
MADGFDMDDFDREMREQGSDSFSMTVTRKPQRGRTISAEAMEQMYDVFVHFLGARLQAAVDRSPEGHSSVRMDLTLTINGESRLVPDLIPWWEMVDGEHRGKAH